MQGRTGVVAAVGVGMPECDNVRSDGGGGSGWCWNARVRQCKVGRGACLIVVTKPRVGQHPLAAQALQRRELGRRRISGARQ